jgi:hypothetical protein
MNPTTNVPLTVTPEAAARVAELGMQRELEEMLERARQSVPDLRAIDVQLWGPYDEGDEPRVVILATKASRILPYDPTENELGRWEVTTFPPDVCRHFVMLIMYETGDGR